MTAEQALDLIREDLNKVEKALVDNISSDISLVNEVASYLLSSGGKRLRPAFMILSSKMCGYSGEKHIMLSVVIEYIHSATLLHDDIIDGAKYRRGIPSANSIYGNDITVLCGDFLYSRGYLTLTEWGDKSIQKILSSTALKMSEGEVLQLLKTADINISMDDYLRIIECKTAILFSSSCEIGARLSGLSEKECKNMSLFGKYLGLAFQMSDDILDYMGESNITGKSIGTDLKESKLTLPVILLISEASSDENKRISNIFSSDNKTDEDLQYLLKLMQKYDIKEKSEKIMIDYISKAVDFLSNFPSSQYKEALTTLAEAMVHRKR